MPTSHALSSSSEAETVIRPLANAFRLYSGPCFAFRFWDGSTWTSASDTAAFVVSFKTERAWKHFCTHRSSTALAESFVAGDIDVDGNLYVALRSYPAIRERINRPLGSAIAVLLAYLKSISKSLASFLALNRTPYVSETGTSTSIHSERPYEWYRLWLGTTMSSSSAYFHTFEESLDQAQASALDHICKKLQFVQRDRFLDLSSGWGSLLLHAASHYDISAHGFCQDNEQLAATALRIVEADLTSRCDVHFESYKDLQRINLPFTKIASVGVSEYVAEKQLPQYFRCVSGKLHKEGLFLCDFITCSTSLEGFSHLVPGWGVLEHKFPSLSAVLKSAENAGLCVVNVEEMSKHYEETLRLWFREMTKHRHDLSRSASRKSVRAWELYLACSAESLRAGETSLHQILFRRGPGEPIDKPEATDRRERDGDLYPLSHVPRSLNRGRRSSDGW